MKFSRGEVVFYRLKIRSKTVNVAEVNVEKLEVTGTPPHLVDNVDKPLTGVCALFPLLVFVLK
ncbi:hypothetical protein E2C01_033859 [Portunus trituberculatus]|uniref:Uncharacterized protein n=1 Tax=Portunus trituberculatus TaxID=210409 RepID=A0A5B7F6T4_PORTR|nr:hypothetical protein [Portunus trituberculatus]